MAYTLSELQEIEQSLVTRIQHNKDLLAVRENPAPPSPLTDGLIKADERRLTEVRWKIQQLKKG
jgi:hypothetical protein